MDLVRNTAHRKNEMKNGEKTNKKESLLILVLVLQHALAVLLVEVRLHGTKLLWRLAVR